MSAEFCSDPVMLEIDAYRSQHRGRRDAAAVAKVIGATTVFGVLAWLACRSGHTIVRVALMGAAGFVLSGFLNLAHECLHRSLVRAKAVNAIIGNLAANVLFVNYTAYTDKHLKHHRCVATDEDTESAARFDTLRAYTGAMTGIGFLVANLRLNARLIGGDAPPYLATTRRKSRARREGQCIAAWLLVVVAVAAAWPLALFTAYIGPVFFAYFWLMFFGLPEHYGCEPVQPRYLASRTTTSNAIVRFFMWNANFHTEHHRYPGAPAPLLAQIAARADVGMHRESSYLKWHWRVCRELLQRREHGATHG
ncbi:fatty acid desaturase family protein [Burkholderia cenocepacia]|uniref:fatty acid desaturase family protein n=1 Tax=Burkholderia cenocepacia TaxID=95486 RepID=UPI002AAF87D8|nr:fatty acid desaturase [Burkholderia cenocepacia]